MFYLYSLFQQLQMRIRGEDGAVATEYAVLLTGIAVAIIAAVGIFGGKLITIFTNTTP